MERTLAATVHALRPAGAAALRGLRRCTPIGEHHCKVGRDLTRVVAGPARAQHPSTSANPPLTPGPVWQLGQLSQQLRPGMRRHPDPPPKITILRRRVRPSTGGGTRQKQYGDGGSKLLKSLALTR